MRRVLAALASFVVIVGLPPAMSMPRGPLPTFDLLAADGTRISSADLLGREQWIVIYAMPGCRPCDDLLASLGRLPARGVLRRAVLVIGGTPDEARAYVEQALPKELRRLRWYADDTSVWQALQLVGTRTLVGIREGRLEWAISGAVSDSRALGRAFSSWLDDSVDRGQAGQ